MTSTTPGWYPDPASPEHLRWWDGTQWTEHTAPAQGPALTASVTPHTATPIKRGRAKLWLIVGAAVLVPLLVITIGFLALRASFAAPSSQLNTEVVSSAKSGYDYTEPMLDLAPSTEITFPVDFDWDARYLEEGESAGWAFEFYLDPTLTRVARAWVQQDSAGKPVAIRPFESNHLSSDAGEGAYVMPEDRTYGGWGLQPEYYLVRKIDAKGNALEVPIVTKVTVEKEFESPVVSAQIDPADGTINLSWEPVEGATSYVVVGSSNVRTETDRYQYYKLYGTTSELEWSTKDKLARDTASGPYASDQNLGFELFDGLSADEMLGDNVVTFEDDSFVYEKSGYAWSVLATDGKSYSQLAEVDVSSIAGSLPARTAWNAMIEMGTSTTMSDLAGGPETITKLYPFTGLDGATRTTQARIPEDGVEANGDEWVIRLEGVGTQLGKEIHYTYYNTTPGDPAAFIEQFNRAAEEQRQKTGLSNFTVISGTPEEVTEMLDSAATEPADTDYPVYGSDDFVRFIGSHLIAGTDYIDVTDFAQKPGAQTFVDAFSEAFYQNPYAVGVPYFTASAPFNPIRSNDGREIYHLNFDLDASQREQLQSALAQNVKSVLAATVHEGMSARDKAVAINDWLSANAEYDYAALAASESGADIAPIVEAWRADGVFGDGTVVCLGYSEAYSALMNAAGVPTVVVTGDVLSGGPHAWNKVNIDGTWLSVDTTWNDSSTPNQYLLIADSEFTEHAARSEDDSWVRNDQLAAYATP